MATAANEAPRGSSRLAGACWMVWHVTFALLVVIPAGALLLAIFVITAPYTLFYYSPNWGMQMSNAPPVEVYLNHFDRMHPDLMSYASAALKNAMQPYGQGNNQAWSVRYWPRHPQAYAFTRSAGLFGRLEAAGWDRKLLWTFLRDEVERAGCVTDAETAAFAAVMDIMNSHRLIDWITESLGRVFALFQRPPRILDEATVAQRFALVSLPVCFVRADSINWILRRGVILVPDGKTGQWMRSLASFDPVWTKASKVDDLEQGVDRVWQYIDDKAVK